MSDGSSRQVAFPTIIVRLRGATQTRTGAAAPSEAAPQRKVRDRDIRVPSPGESSATRQGFETCAVRVVGNQQADPLKSAPLRLIRFSPSVRTRTTTAPRHSHYDELADPSLTLGALIRLRTLAPFPFASLNGPAAASGMIGRHPMQVLRWFDCSASFHDDKHRGQFSLPRDTTRRSHSCACCRCPRRCSSVY